MHLLPRAKPYKLAVLGDSDAHQNLVQLADEFGIGIILTYKGSKTLVEESAYLVHKKSRDLVPRPPKIQELLKLALSLKERFQREPDCTRSQAAQDLGLSERRLYQIMRLLRLEPEKQRHILDLPLALGRGSLTERALRPSLL